MVTTGGLFSQTLQDITNTKLEELAKKRQAFEDRRQQLLDRIEHEQDDLTILTAVADGVRSCFEVAMSGGRVVRGSSGRPRLEIDLINLAHFLRQACYDPSISSEVMGRWKQSFLRHLDIQSLKFSFASLYGQLTTEWLQSTQTITAQEDTDAPSDDFEHIANMKKLKSRIQWEQTSFQSASTDEAAVTQLLNVIFDTSLPDSKKLKEAFETLRQKVWMFEHELTGPSNFTIETLGWTIESLAASDLLTEEKRAVLKDFASNQVIMIEIADVLNMRLVSLDTWTWSHEIQLEERRRVNGTYSIHMHEDLLQAIFLQYIGIKWSVFWKEAFTDLRKDNGIWKSPRSSIPSIARKRRQFYLGQQVYATENVQSVRQKLYRRSYFVSRLLDSETQRILNIDGDEEAEIDDNADWNIPEFQASTDSRKRKSTVNIAPRRRLASNACRKAVSDKTYIEPADPDDERDDHDNFDEPKDPMKAKQTLLHLLSTEIIIKTGLHGELSCFRSQFENLYPSLPHSTIMSVLKFFGTSDKWLAFFKKFLQAPLRFVGDSSAPRHRLRGVPDSHVLSEVFGEVVLFCLDFKINQETEGELLWRVNDDIWFWSSDYDRCAKAWTAVTSFAETVGLCMNKARSGSARMLQKQENGVRSIFSVPVESPLPDGQVRWGMLYLNPDSGKFELDGDMVDEHIHELSRQLQNKSVFAWIQAWNTYATTFFTSNFGQPANCFGRQHVDDMLATHEKIQRQVFSSSTDTPSTANGSVVSFLRQTIEQRFGHKDIPSGYFFFPVELGGLELVSPFIGLLQIRNKVPERPEDSLDVFEEAEREEYERAKIAHQEGDTGRDDLPNNLKYIPDQPDVFMPFEEYTRYREVLGYGFPGELVQVFNNLLECPRRGGVETDDSGSIKLALNSLANQSNLRGILSNFNQMEPYWKWVVQLYGPEVIDRFGGFNIVDPGLLPIGMVNLFRSGRVKWQD